MRFPLPVSGSCNCWTIRRYVKDQLQVSPDGQWIAFNSDESKSWEVYVARFPGLQTNGGFLLPAASNRGGGETAARLFYLAPDGKMMVVPSPRDGSSGVRPLFSTSLSPPSHQLSEYDVTSDGQRFLVLEPASSRPQTLTFLLNWSHAE